MRNLTAAILLCVTFSSVHAQWGDLTATFELDRTVTPIAIPVPMNWPAKVPPPVDETILLSPTLKLENVVVFLPARDATEEVPVHSMYAKPAAVPVNIFGCRYLPRVTLLQVNQELSVTNLDAFGHVFAVSPPSSPAANPILAATKSHSLQFKAAEEKPTEIYDNIYPNMAGYLLIRDNPYMGVSNPAGVVTIKNIPEGNWEFVVWHERCGFITQVNLNGARVRWKKGRTMATIENGKATSLGTVRISADFLTKH